jgi:flagellar biosynthesis/type III secretory pathway protein FliH
MSEFDMNIDLIASARVLRGSQIALADDALVLLGRWPAAADATDPEAVDNFAAPPAVDEVAELRAQLDGALAKLEQQAAAAKSSERDAYQRGLASGREEGKAAAQRDAQTQTRLLETALSEAVAGLQKSLGNLEASAAAVALTAVEQVLGNDKASAKNIRLALSRQLSQLREATVVEIRVSPADFPDMTELDELAKRNGHAAVVKHEQTLTSGQCRIRLGLGELAIDLPHQLTALRQLLAGTH